MKTSSSAAARVRDAYWTRDAAIPSFPSLTRDLKVDVVVIGAGLTGMTTAYLLQQAGLRVAIVERERCAAVDTGSTTAHLTCVTDTSLTSLVERFGEDHARATWDAGLAAIAQIDQVVRDEAMECHFAWVPGYLHLPLHSNASESMQQLDALQRIAEAATAMGFDATMLNRVPFLDVPGVEFPNQARFHPRMYLAGLLAAVQRGGGVIFEHTAAEEVGTDPLAVVSQGHRIQCRAVVVATHNPIMGKAGWFDATLLQAKLSLYTSYAVAGRTPSGTVPDALFWEMADPYLYLRVDRHRDHDIVILGGEDHKTGQVEDTTMCFQRLEERLHELVPQARITHRWSGQVIETHDGLPFIGELAPGQFVATGYSGNGMTFGTVAAMMATDAILGQKNPWVQLFDVGRTNTRGGLWDYIKENKDYPYYLVRDRFAGPEARDLREVPRGEGRIMLRDGAKVAAFRDDDGSVSVRSATCTHMGCVVQWNSAERTWDCPCHGSRFSTDGRVLSGPAGSPLKEIAVQRGT